MWPVQKAAQLDSVCAQSSFTGPLGPRSPREVTERGGPRLFAENHPAFRSLEIVRAGNPCAQPDPHPSWPVCRLVDVLKTPENWRLYAPIDADT